MFVSSNEIPLPALSRVLMRILVTSTPHPDGLSKSDEYDALVAAQNRLEDLSPPDYDSSGTMSPAGDEEDCHSTEHPDLFPQRLLWKCGGFGQSIANTLLD